MGFGTLSRLLHRSAPLGQLVWWTSAGPEPSAAELQRRWARAGLPPTPSPGLALALEHALEGWLGVPLLERSGVCWLAPRFEAHLATLRGLLAQFPGWELHTVPVSATEEALAALRASARRLLTHRLDAVAAELEPQLGQPRTRASLLVRRLDELELLRQHGQLHAEVLGLEHPGLGARLDDFARRIDAALCARIVA